MAVRSLLAMTFGSLSLKRSAALVLAIAIAASFFGPLSATDVEAQTPDRGAGSPPPGGGSGSTIFPGPGITAVDIALAMDISGGVLVNADIGTSQPEATGISDTPVGVMPSSGDTFGILATGLAESADDPDDNNDETLGGGGAGDDVTTELGGLNTPGPQGGEDMVQLTLEIAPPDGLTCFTFDFEFLSEEFPDWVGSDFNDTFIAEVGVSNFTIDTFFNVIAPNNIAFDTNNDVISVNTNFGFDPLDENPNTNSTYDGTTGLLRATGPLPLPGEGNLFLILSIMDLGDSILDSAVFLDNFQFGTQDPCVPGAVIVDTTPPRCEVIRVNNDGNLEIEVQDTGSGIQVIEVLVAENATVEISGNNDLNGDNQLIGDNAHFYIGTDLNFGFNPTGVFHIVGTKINPDLPANIQIRAVDVAGNVAECDPVLAQLDRSPSSARYSTYDAIPQVDRYFTISNTGESVVTYALVNVNDKWFIMPTLLPYQIKTIDIGSAMVAGAKNTVTVWGGGHGSQVMISDVIPRMTNTFAYPDAPLY